MLIFKLIIKFLKFIFDFELFYLAYEQQFVRTMFFEKVEKKFIDGTEW